MSRRAAVASATIVGAVAVAACGVGGNSELQRVDSDDLFGLDETTTTSSTTTTTTIVVEPSVSVDPTAAATSTTIATEAVLLYFLDGDRLGEVSINLARDPSANIVMTALAEGPPTDQVGIGLQSVVPRTLISSVSESGAGFVTVDLAAGPFERIEPRDQRFAIAQIVLTLTRRPGIGQVQFTVDGEPQAVFGQGGVQTEPGDLVSRVDYQSLLREQLDPETTTEPPTTPAPTTIAVETTPPTT